MSKEYLDRKEVIKILERYDLSSGSTLGYHSGAIECAIAEIGMLPAADVAPVVRCKDCKWYTEAQCGRWVHSEIEDDDWGRTFHSWACSVCGYSVGNNPTGENFRPNCGARMDVKDGSRRNDHDANIR